ncbi:MAG: hypothetical protein QOD92_1178 [Acidimicrobiaceae bacterium]
MKRAWGALALLAVLVLGACSGGNSTTTATPTSGYPHDGELRLNDIQSLGSHNSYHVQGEQPLFDALKAFDANLASTLEYTHAPLAEQFNNSGVRQIELDVFADPAGGLYANRAGNAVIGKPKASGEPELDKPGFKVFHVQDIDFRSTCLTFVACLTNVRDWSRVHQGHVPLMILVEAKQEAIPDPVNLGFVTPHAIGAPELDALDAEIRSVFDDNEIITPDVVRGKHTSLEDAIRTDGWPTLGASRGKVLFALDNEDGVRDAYVAGHPALQGRVLFTSSPRGTPEAAFLKLNDPIKDETTIRQAVLDGYIVRTRSDGDTVQARSGDTTMREAALRSGAQWVSTDYEVADAKFGTGYVVAIPGGTPSRCNPVRLAVRCTPADIENPTYLSAN